jgi:S1-C subfamily serine protease
MNRRRLREFAFALALLLVGPTRSAAGQVTANILSRVFQIRYGGLASTAFTIEVDRRQYLVTARHVVADVSDGTSISLLREGRWVPYTVKSVPVDPPEADLAVLALPAMLPQTLPVQAAYEGLTLGEELYFLGFPYGISFPGAPQASGFSLPFVKHGICSAFGSVKGVDYIFLDGHDNAGLSGGPIVRANSRGITIVGVVSGFRHSDEPVFKDGKESEFQYRANTGIVLGIGISHALRAISKRPVGAPLPPG